MVKRLPTPPEQKQFITDNMHHLAAFAWEGYQGDGRGTDMAITSARKPQPGSFIAASENTPQAGTFLFFP